MILYTKQENGLKGTGSNANIVMSSRVRLARNLGQTSFPNKASKKDLNAVLSTVENAIKGIAYFKNATLFKIHELDNVNKQFLIERHLMSHDHANNPEGKAVLISKEEVLSVMINEEDHLRIQVMQSGFNLNETWDIINSIDDSLSKKLDYAFSPHWGYLTACPTNTGTAMRGSLMLHLPALVMTKQINKVLAAISKLNFCVTRFLWGRNTGEWKFLSNFQSSFFRT